jgi:hypothetical protein
MSSKSNIEENCALLSTEEQSSMLLNTEKSNTLNNAWDTLTDESNSSNTQQKTDIELSDLAKPAETKADTNNSTESKTKDVIKRNSLNKLIVLEYYLTTCVHTNNKTGAITISGKTLVSCRNYCITVYFIINSDSLIGTTGTPKNGKDVIFTTTFTISKYKKINSSTWQESHDVKSCISAENVADFISSKIEYVHLMNVVCKNILDNWILSEYVNAFLLDV